MQERLDKWKKNVLPVPSAELLRGKQCRPAGRGEYGDALTEEEWEEEIKKSQKRK